jgi:hypothetical protein
MTSRRILAVWSLVVVAASQWLPSAFAASPGAATPVNTKTSTAADRKEVAVTVYSGGFGLVREVRDVDVGSGRVSLELRDVTSQIQPETVAMHSLGGAHLGVLEQDYRYDLLTPQKLLEKYVGRKVRVYRYSERLGKDDVVDADVLSVAGNQTVLRVNGEVTYDYPGRFAFPEVPANLIPKPTLVWLLDSGAAKQVIEVTYLTRGFGWHADYVLVLNDTDTAGDLTGWVTLSNTSGAAFENAKLKLVAGNVQRAAERAGTNIALLSGTASAPVAAQTPQFLEQGFFEYHLYTLQRPTTLLDNEQKQVMLLDAPGVRTRKRLVFAGQQFFYANKGAGSSDDQKASVYLEIENKDDNHMGMPLPRGTVHVYKADKSGARQLVGEDTIDHTPRDERVKIKLGDAFDVVASRKQTAWQTLGKCRAESEWEISVRNHKDTIEEVEDTEPLGGEWEVVSETMPHTKKDATAITYTVKVPARGESVIRYRVRVTWC